MAIFLFVWGIVVFGRPPWSGHTKAKVWRNGFVCNDAQMRVRKTKKHKKREPPADDLRS